MLARDRAVWFVRHGLRLDFVDPSWGESVEYPIDPPLAPDGIIQAHETAQRLASEQIGHIFASPFQRAMETASQMAEVLRLPILVEPGLREMMVIEWYPQFPAVMSAEQLWERFDLVNPEYVPRSSPTWPETRKSARERCEDTMQRLVGDFNGNLVIVSHGGVIGHLCRGLMPEGELNLHVAMCSLVKLNCRSGRWTLELSGHDTSHLSRTESDVRIF